MYSVYLNLRVYIVHFQGRLRVYTHAVSYQGHRMEWIGIESAYVYMHQMWKLKYMTAKNIQFIRPLLYKDHVSFSPLLIVCTCTCTNIICICKNKGLS